jgi:hypothetical protein
VKKKCYETLAGKGNENKERERKYAKKKCYKTLADKGNENKERKGNT